MNPTENKFIAFDLAMEIISPITAVVYDLISDQFIVG